MIRRGIGAVLIALLSVAPLAADGEKGQNAASKSSGGKRAAWIAIGVAAGFGAGLLIGLNAFDDAIDSDRKVWTTAIVAAAAGGVTGGLLSRSISRAAPTGRPIAAKPQTLDISWQSALKGHPAQSLSNPRTLNPEP